MPLFERSGTVDLFPWRQEFLFKVLRGAVILGAGATGMGISRALAEQLSGDLDWQTGGSGVRATFSMPRK